MTADAIACRDGDDCLGGYSCNDEICGVGEVQYDGGILRRNDAGLPYIDAGQIVRDGGSTEVSVDGGTSLSTLTPEQETCLDDARVVLLMNGSPHLEAYKRSGLGWGRIVPDGFDHALAPQQTGAHHLALWGDRLLVSTSYGLQEADASTFEKVDIRANSSYSPATSADYRARPSTVKIDGNWVYAGDGIEIFHATDPDHDYQDGSGSPSEHWWLKREDIRITA
ncbi:MAG: hypothetical protein GY813_04415 [Halieaceae bacterium]|nr:hypothetical protein [Halieaceae bacterium]